MTSEIGGFSIGFSAIGGADTGPPYPRPPGAGSNAIGLFEVGVSAIGDISIFDFWQTIASQYANSPRVIELIESFILATDPTTPFEKFHDYIWNVLTARGYGLDVWGRIVGINRVLQITTGEWFGFEEATDAEPFNTAPFYNGVLATTNFTLSDEQYRKLIIAKARFNITDGSVPSINEIMMYLWANRGGNAYANDGRQYDYFGFEEARNCHGFNQSPLYSGQPIPHMCFDYVFEFPLTGLDWAIINSGVLPKPTGVKSSVWQNI